MRTRSAFDPAPFDDAARARIWRDIQLRVHPAGRAQERRARVRRCLVVGALAAAGALSVFAARSPHVIAKTAPSFSKTLTASVAPLTPAPALAALPAPALAPAQAARLHAATQIAGAMPSSRAPLLDGTAHAREAAFAASAPPEATSVETLFADADAARKSGHPREALAPLWRIVREHGADSRAGLAAFSIGRIHFDALDEPRDASRAFATAIDLGLPPSLLQDAHARQVEALLRGGDRLGAQALAMRAVATYPALRQRLSAALAP